jgi:hypothetical protein
MDTYIIMPTMHAFRLVVLVLTGIVVEMYRKPLSILYRYRTVISWIWDSDFLYISTDINNGPIMMEVPSRPVYLVSSPRSAEPCDFNVLNCPIRDNSLTGFCMSIFGASGDGAGQP